MVDRQADGRSPCAHFLASDFTHAWVMDDDILPDPRCLTTLWEAASDDPTSAFLFPIAIQPDGAVGRWGSWCGFLISREIVAKVGVADGGALLVGRGRRVLRVANP